MKNLIGFQRGLVGIDFSPYSEAALKVLDRVWGGQFDTGFRWARPNGANNWLATNNQGTHAALRSGLPGREQR